MLFYKKHVEIGMILQENCKFAYNTMRIQEKFKKDVEKGWFFGGGGVIH